MKYYYIRLPQNFKEGFLKPPCEGAKTPDLTKTNKQMKTGPFRFKVLTQPLMYLPLLVCGSAANNFSDAGSI